MWHNATYAEELNGSSAVGGNMEDCKLEAARAALRAYNRWVARRAVVEKRLQRAAMEGAPMQVRAIAMRPGSDPALHDSAEVVVERVIRLRAELDQLTAGILAVEDALEDISFVPKAEQLLRQYYLQCQSSVALSQHIPGGCSTRSRAR